MRSRSRLALDGASAAWLAAIPLALLAVPLVALLARPLGLLLVPQIAPTDLFGWAQRYFRPEPREQGMYALSLAVPVALSGGIALMAGRVVALPPRLVGVLVHVARGMLALAVLACVVAQYRIRYEWRQGPAVDRFFTPATLVAAALIAAAVLAGLRSDAVRLRVAGALRDSPARRIGALALAVAITALWLLHAVNSDRSIAWEASGVISVTPYASDETFALLNGLTPLVDARLPYGMLWPYLTGLPLLAFGKTLLTYTLTTSAITALALLAGYGILHRVTRSSLGALLLYLPFLATSLFLISSRPPNALTPATYLGDFPLRSAAPLLLAWLTARELDGDRLERRLPWALFAAAGVVLVNNIGVGLPALGAALLAVAASATHDRRALGRLARGVVSGLLVAVAAVTVVTLARSGALPHFGQLSEHSRVFLAGFMATPLHGVLGVHFAIYLTFVAAIATAAVRIRGGSRERVLDGMLLWNGIFGLGALSYFVAESGPMWLTASFSTWALTLMLLVIVVARRTARGGTRRPDAGELAVLFGLGVMVCSLAQFSPPWSQLERLTSAHGGATPTTAEVEPFVPDPRARSFIASLADGDALRVKRGAPVALLFDNSHRVADAYGVVNVSPYTSPYQMATPRSLRTVVDALRHAGGNTLVTPLEREPTADFEAALPRLGFALVMSPRGRGPWIVRLRDETLVKWVDLRHLHPRALRGGHGRFVGRARLATR